MVMGELDIGLKPDTIHPKDDIVGVVVQDTEVDTKRSTSIHCSML